MPNVVLTCPSEMREQTAERREEAGGRRLAKTGAAAALVASLAILVTPMDGAFADPPTGNPLRSDRALRRHIMMQECILAGRITRLAIFRVPEFGTRASFQIECAGQPPAICAVDGDIARKFAKHYCEGDIVVVTGFHEPRPSTAAANTPWIGRFRVRDIRPAEDVRLAA